MAYHLSYLFSSCNQRVCFIRGRFITPFRYSDPLKVSHDFTGLIFVIYGSIKKIGHWRIRTNWELSELHKSNEFIEN